MTNPHDAGPHPGSPLPPDQAEAVSKLITGGKYGAGSIYDRLLAKLDLNEDVGADVRAVLESATFKSFTAEQKLYARKLLEEDIRAKAQDDEHVTALLKAYDEQLLLVEAAAALPPPPPAPSTPGAPRAPEGGAMAKPKVQRFEIRGGNLVQVMKRGGDDEYTRPSWEPYTLPAWFSDIKGDSEKEKEFFDALFELYNKTARVDVLTARAERKKDGRIVGLRAVFPHLKGRPERPIVVEAGMLDAMNEKEQAKKDYRDTPDVEGFIDRQGERVRAKQVRELLGQLHKMLVPEKKVVAPPTPAGPILRPPPPPPPFRTGAPPPPPPRRPEPLSSVEVSSPGLSVSSRDILSAASLSGRDLQPRLSPMDAGLTSEQGRRLKELVREVLVKAYAEALMKKYSKMAADPEHARKTAEMILDDAEVEKKYQERLVKLRESK